MGLRGKITEGQCHSYYVESAYQQHDLLWMLASITWLRWCLSGFSTVKLLFFPLYAIMYFPERSYYAQLTLYEWEVTLHLLKGKVFA